MEDDKASIKTIYDTPASTIFKKQFIAGFAHGLGGFVITLVTWVLIYVLTIMVIIPQLQSLLAQINVTTQNLQKVNPLNNSGSNGNQIQLPSGIMQQLQNLQGK
ncbi:MAG TPA: hypothetical protein VLH19_05445 [Patescibacteria group bacterium]|nr:hypothetical protein [Patescibacteria group bacterium]